MYYHFYLSPFIFSCKESFNSSSFLKFEILISWASSPLGYAYYILVYIVSICERCGRFVNHFVIFVRSQLFWTIHSRDMKTQHIKFEILNELLTLFKCNLIQLNFVLNMPVMGRICNANFRPLVTSGMTS